MRFTCIVVHMPTGEELEVIYVDLGLLRVYFNYVHDRKLPNHNSSQRLIGQLCYEDISLLPMQNIQESLWNIQVRQLRILN